MAFDRVDACGWRADNYSGYSIGKAFGQRQTENALDKQTLIWWILQN